MDDLIELKLITRRFKEEDAKEAEILLSGIF